MWRGKVKRRTAASAAELALGAGAWRSEGRAAEGEQKIEQLKKREHTNNRAEMSLQSSLLFALQVAARRGGQPQSLSCMRSFQQEEDLEHVLIWPTVMSTQTKSLRNKLSTSCGAISQRNIQLPVTSMITAGCYYSEKT